MRASRLPPPLQVCMIETYKERQQNAAKQRDARRRYLARCRAVQDLQRQVPGLTLPEGCFS